MARALLQKGLLRRGWFLPSRGLPHTTTRTKIVLSPRRACALIKWVGFISRAIVVQRQFVGCIGLRSSRYDDCPSAIQVSSIGCTSILRRPTLNMRRFQVLCGASAVSNFSLLEASITHIERFVLGPALYHSDSCNLSHRCACRKIYAVQRVYPLCLTAVSQVLTLDSHRSRAGSHTHIADCSKYRVYRKFPVHV